MTRPWLHTGYIVCIFILYVITAALQGLYYDTLEYNGKIQHNEAILGNPNNTIGLSLSMKAYYFSGIYTTITVAQHDENLYNTVHTTNASVGFLPFLEQNWNTLVNLAIDEKTAVRDCMSYTNMNIASLIIELTGLINLFQTNTDATTVSILTNTTNNIQDSLSQTQELLQITDPSTTCKAYCLGSKIVMSIALAFLGLVVLVSLLTTFTTTTYNKIWPRSKMVLLLIVLFASVVLIGLTEAQINQCNPYDTLENSSEIIKSLIKRGQADACDMEGFTPNMCIEIGDDNIPYLDVVTDSTCTDSFKTCAELSDTHSTHRGIAIYIFWTASLLCFFYVALLLYIEITGNNLQYTSVNKQNELWSFI